MDESRGRLWLVVQLIALIASERTRTVNISDAATAFLRDAERTSCQWSRESSKCIVMRSAVRPVRLHDMFQRTALDCGYPSVHTNETFHVSADAAHSIV